MDKKVKEEFCNMKELIAAVGESCLDRHLPKVYKNNIYAVSWIYRELEVIRNIDRQNHTQYYTVVNKNNHTHIHAKTKNAAYKICDCYHELISQKDISRYKKAYRMNALALSGQIIRLKRDD